MSAEQNKMSIRRWVEVAWNNGNLAIADEVYSTDYLLHDPAGPIHGPEALKQFVATFQTAYPDIHATIEDMIAEGNKVVWRYTVRGTHHGSFMGIAPTGKSITLTGILISRFADDKVVEDWNNYDALGMMQQLGVIPAMG
ncbi:MAG TPA: ester cyclase [Ktedonobacteraceae bacterium]